MCCNVLVAGPLGNAVDLFINLLRVVLQAGAILATLLAIGVAIWAALMPGIRTEKRRKAEARLLRARLTAAIAAVNPTFQTIGYPDQVTPETQEHKLEPDALIEAMEKIDGLLALAAILEPEEQDDLGPFITNGYLTAKRYKTHDVDEHLRTLCKKRSEEILDLADLFKKCGYFSKR